MLSGAKILERLLSSEIYLSALGQGNLRRKQTVKKMKNKCKNPNIKTNKFDIKSLQHVTLLIQKTN